MAIRRVSGRVLEETSKGRDKIKAIAGIERSQERERRRGAREGKKTKKGNRLCIWLSPTCNQRGKEYAKVSNSLHGR
jgi:hypothetical protein